MMLATMGQRTEVYQGPSNGVVRAPLKPAPGARPPVVGLTRPLKTDKRPATFNHSVRQDAAAAVAANSSSEGHHAHLQQGINGSEEAPTTLSSLTTVITVTQVPQTADSSGKSNNSSVIQGNHAAKAKEGNQHQKLGPQVTDDLDFSNRWEGVCVSNSD